MILGVEIREGSVAAARIGDDGRLEARALRPGVSGESVAAAIGEISLGQVSRLGIAVRDPHDDSTTSAIIAGSKAAGGSPSVVTRGAAVALAEHWCGAAKGAEHVVALTAVDCVHAGLVIGGRPFRGAHGMAGAAGWLALNPVERDDYRKLGCLEAEIGASGIVRRLVWRLKAGDRSRALELAGGDMAAITVTHIFDAARRGDGVAVGVVRDTARYVGMAIGNLVAVVDPEVVVLGGFIADAADLLLEPSRLEAGRRMPQHIARSLSIEPASLGDDAGAIGAARAAMLAT